MRAKKARREEADATRKKIEEQEAKNAHALKGLSKKWNEFPAMLYMNSDELDIVFCWFGFVYQIEEAPPFSCCYYSILFKTTAHILWLMSGKAAIVHRTYLRTWLIKSFCKPREVEDCKEIDAAFFR
jgi:hypothetical protein